jgi:hypothetical protein
MESYDDINEWNIHELKGRINAVINILNSIEEDFNMLDEDFLQDFKEMSDSLKWYL